MKLKTIGLGLILKLILLLLFCDVLYAQKWAARTSSSFTNEAYDVETDAMGNSYVCGYFSGETSFSTTISFPDAIGNGDIFIAKYNSQGEVQWVKTYGGNFSDRAYDLALTPNNELIVCGQFYGSMTVGSTILNGNGTSKDIFLIKLDNSGNEMWALSEGGNLEDNAYGVATDNDGNVLLTGQFKGAASIGGQVFVSDLNANTSQPSNDFFISKYDPTGVNLWVKIGSASYEERGTAVATDNNNNIILTGQFSDTLNFAGTTIYNNAYNIGFLAKMDPNGNLLWFNKLQAGFCATNDVEVNSSNEILVVGDFLGSLNYIENFNVSPIMNTFTRKVFVLKTNSDGNFVWSNTLGSENSISARALAINSDKEVFVCGNFECSLGQLNTPNGHFNSVGFKDIYTWKIANSGVTHYVQQIGGQLNDEAHGIALIDEDPLITGGYTNNLNFPDPVDINYPPTYSNQTLNQFNLHHYTNEPFFFLPGDSSRNFFLSNYVNDDLNTYRYYYTNYFVPSDTAQTPFVTTDWQWFIHSDTLALCNDTILKVNPMTYYNSGPSYNYLWNTGGVMDFIEVNSSGDYGLQLERTDVCWNFSDSLFFIRNLKPDPPLISDNFGIAVNQPPLYPIYELCQDSIEIWFTEVCLNCDITIYEMGNAIHFDSTPNYYQQGNYNVVVSNGVCWDQEGFEVIVSDSIDYDILIVPNIVMHDTVDFNDSIVVCANEDVIFELHDTILNPSGIYDFSLPYPIFQNVFWQVTSPSNISYSSIEDSLYPIRHDFHPIETGWHEVSCHIIFGKENACNIDTVHFFDTQYFYIEVLPIPMGSSQLNLSNLICPGGSAYLTVNPPLQNGFWVGPTTDSITWSGQFGDSALIHSEGLYHYWANLMDSTTGCSNLYHDTIYVGKKTPPTIMMNPVDGIVCPYDSVLMTVLGTYVNYDWHGPEGNSLSTSNIHLDEDLGFYYCIVEDNEGCFLTTPQVELNEYSSPSFVIEPSAVFCGEPITIQVIGDPGLQIQWLPPLSGDSSIQTVMQPGWYYCEMQQCGLTFVDSVEIIDGTFVPQIAASDTLLCDGEVSTVYLMNSNYSGNWNNGSFGAQILVDQAGSYSALVTNSFGCMAESNSIQISFMSYPETPVITDTFVCASGSLTLSSAPYEVVWFDMDSNYVAYSQELHLPSISQDISVYYSLEVTDCDYQFEEVLIHVVQNDLISEINGPLQACSSDSVVLVGTSNGSTLYWYDNNNQILSSDSIVVITHNQGSHFYIIASNDCYSDTVNYSIEWLASHVIELNIDSVISCPDNVVSIGSNLNFDLMWSTSSGNYYGTQLDLFGQEIEGMIIASGSDSFGCPLIPDTAWVLIPDHYVSIDVLQAGSCFGDTISLSVSSTLDSLFWSSDNQLITNSDTLMFEMGSAINGWVSINASDTLGCFYSDSVWIESPPMIFNSWPNDTIICSEQELYFDENSAYEFNWMEEYIDFSPGQSETLFYSLTDASGCFIIDSITVSIVDCEDTTPNVITPNGDGINDVLVIEETALYPKNGLIILNRWGSIVFEAYPYLNNFDGYDLTEGVYFYTFFFNTENMENFKTQILYLLRD
jgi:gliding motility-associated-like protein